MRVLYMSGYSQEIIDGYGAMDFGQGFLQKPFTKKFGNQGPQVVRCRHVLAALTVILASLCVGRYRVNYVLKFPERWLPPAWALLFIAERHHRIDPCGAFCWQVRRQKRYEDQKRCYTKNGHGIGGTDAV